MSIESPNLLVIEDHPAVIMCIEDQLQPTPINIVGVLTNALEAARHFKKIEIGEIGQPDVILLDGHLNILSETVTYTPEARSMLGKIGSKFLANNKETITLGRVNEPCVDAVFVDAIMKASGVTSKVIGTSTDNLRDYGVDLDEQIFKDGIWNQRLVSSVFSVLQD